MERYLTGLLTDLPRKNCDTIAAAVAGTSTERLQHLLTDATWDPQALDQQRVQALVAQSPPQGLLVLDDTGLPKQGRGSVGVARQYSGTLGKVANCQMVVTAHYVADEPTSRAPVHWPLTAQLYLPEGWAADGVRRTKVHVPAEVLFRTKPDLALTLVDQARTWAVPFAYVVTDAGYGDNPTFLRGLDDPPARLCRGRQQHLWGASAGRGARRRARAPAASAGAGPAQEAAPGAACTRRRRYWRPCQRTTGRPSPGVSTQAPSSANNLSPCGCTGPRVVRSSPPRHHRVCTGPEGWLLGERPVPGEHGDVKWYYSNLPAETRAATAGGAGAQPLAHRAILRGRQGRVWPGRLPGPALGWAASASRAGHAGL